MKNLSLTKMMKSKSNSILTLGVEIELQLIDPETYNLSARAEEVLKATSHLKKIKQEFYLSTIEINTDKCSTVHEIKDNLEQTLHELPESSLANLNCGR